MRPVPNVRRHYEPPQGPYGGPDHIQAPVPGAPAAGPLLAALGVFSIVGVLLFLVALISQWQVYDRAVGVPYSLSQPPRVYLPSPIPTPPPVVGQGTLSDDGAAAPAPEGQILGVNVNVREGPSLHTDVVTKLHEPERVRILTKANGWLHVALPSGYKGYIFGAYVLADERLAGYAIGISLGDRVNVRAEPFLGSAVLDRVNRGEKLLVLGEHAGWMSVFIPKGWQGWIRGDFVSRLN